MDYIGYHTYIDTVLPNESPHLYGLHPNAEIGFLSMTSEHLFKTVFELQPRDMGASGGVVITREDKVCSISISFQIHISSLENILMITL